MNTLDQIAIANGTDKATSHPTGAHCYTTAYEKFFEPLRLRELKFLEIGIGGGESIRTWLEYFPSARIFGVDIVKETNDWNTPGTKPNERYTAVWGDQSDETFWNCFFADYGGEWDIVVDDGGHFSNQIITSHKMLWPKVKPGGLYCVEDLAVCYGAGTIFVPEGSQNHMDWLRTLLDAINLGTGDVDSISFFRELAILQKKY